MAVRLSLSKHLDVKQENVGESWEISGVPGNESIVADGEMQGKSLNEVVAERKEASSEKRTTSVSAMSFHCSSSLSMPTATSLSRCILMMKLPKSKVRNAAKTEMWYALPCEPDAKLYNGLKMQITPEQQGDGGE